MTALANYVTNKAVGLSKLNGDNFRYGMQLLDMGYPVMPSYASWKGIDTLKKLEEWFGTKKNVMKYLGAFEQVRDKDDFERYLESPNYQALVKLLGHTRMTQLLKTVKDNDLSMHNYVSNLPKIHEDDNPDEILDFMKKVMKYEYTNMMEVLGYMNYQKVRYAANLDEAKKHIMVIKAAKQGVTAGNIKPAFMAIQQLPTDERTRFTKEPSIIATIGSETHCCFRKGGAASSLLDPAMKSPIAGIIDGRIGKNRWFSFVWEMVEIENGNATVIFDESGEGREVKKFGEVKKTLILDNIEAAGHVQDGSILWDRLRGIKGYKNIYCGYCRNDITFEPGVTDNKKDKQSQLVGFESNFQRYGAYDDSKYLYTIVDNQSDANAWIKRMNPGDLARAKYMEQYIYGVKGDPDFMKIDTYKSPSYIIESTTNIFGYFVTRLKYYNPEEDHGYEQFADVTGKELTEWKKGNKELGYDPYFGLEKVLYLEDILSIDSRECMVAFGKAFEDLANWAKENGVETIVANTNNNSKPFIKRIKDMGFKYMEQRGIAPFTPTNKIENPFRPTSVEVKF
jgi:hypothetical protein